MTTRQRLELLARANPRLFPRRGLQRLLREQLGEVDALDRWILRNDREMRARAPKTIYHICAGNLAISAITSVAHGLLLGSRNFVKLPGYREDSAARKEIRSFITSLPKELQDLVEIHDRIDSKIFTRADAIIAFGSDITMEELRRQSRWDQKFIAHGHAVSLLWIGEPDRLTDRQFDACATDILTYDQLGCLSPQAIYVPQEFEIQDFGPRLALALERKWKKIKPQPPRPLSIAARLAEARDLAFAQGHTVWLAPSRHLGWTVIHDPDPTFQPSPLHGTVYLRQVRESRLPTALASVAGRISTVGLAGKTSSRLRELFLSLGVSRFCPAGRMQFPPLTWHHDGRPVLGDLVNWVDAELR